VKVGDLVVVEWADAVGPVDLEEGERLPLERMETTGWVREVTPQYVTLHPERYLTQSGRVRAATTIGTGYILSVRVIEGARE